MSRKFACIAVTIIGCIALFFAMCVVQYCNSLTRIVEERNYLFVHTTEDLRYFLNRIGDPMRENGLEGQFSAKARVAVRALTDENAGIWDGRVGTFDDGYILKITEKGVEYPADFPYEPKEDKELTLEDFEFVESVLQKSKGSLYNPLFVDSNGQNMVYYRYPIEGDYYYLFLQSYDEWGAGQSRFEEAFSTIHYLEDAYDVGVGILRKEGDGVPTIWPFDLKTEGPEALDVEWTDGFDNDVETSEGMKFYRVSDLKNGYYAVIFTDYIHILVAVGFLPILTLFVISLTVFLIWGFSLYRYVRDHSFSEDRRKFYSPTSVRNRALAYGLLTAVLLSLSAAYLTALNGLFAVNSECEDTLEFLFEQLDRSEEDAINSRSLYDSCLVENLRTAADLMTQYPELQNEDFLKDVSRIVCAEFLVVFDAEGKQLLTDSAYRGFSLGGAGDADGEMRNLMNGVPSVFREAFTEAAIGKKVASVGVPMSQKNDGRYGALIAYINPKTRDELRVVNWDSLLKIAAARTRFLFSVDPETTEVVNSTQSDLRGRDVTEVGLKKSALRDHFMDFFHVLEVPYYGISHAYGDLLFYAARRVGDTLIDVIPFAVTTLILYLILFGIINRILFSGYSSDQLQWIEREDVEEEEDMVTLPSGQKKKSVDVSKRWELLRRLRANKSPEDLAALSAEAMILLFITTVTLVYMFTGRESASIIAYCIYGDWEKGLNIFALTRIFLLLCLTIVGVFLAEVIGFAVSRLMDTKAETIGRLGMNIVKYILVIVFFYCSFDYLGFDTRAILASLGLIGFAVSLGARDMITDVIAGMTIVLEGEYQVGDIVEIGGFRGSVVEIGVRSTKLEGRGGNIKIIANRDVKNVLNMTRLNSWCTVELKVSNEESIEHLEQVLGSGLPEIGRQSTSIISGPFYKGVLSFDGNSKTVSIIAECRENNYHEVQRELMRSLNLLCEKNEIQVR
ncbi:MAG: mechanosensitive ion channel family protein [Lachnospiraceae bacterium]|nr:mechanosensitive ion channel family protein [Lachnospiraceae bacterium]